MVNLKWPVRCFAILASLCVQPSDEFRVTEGEPERVVHAIQLRVGWLWRREVSEPEDSNGTCLLFPFDDECIAVVLFETIGDLLDTGFVFVRQGFKQADPLY